MTGRQAGTAVVAIMFLLAAGPAFAKPKSSPPEERAKAVAFSRELEAQPMGEEAAAKRAWLIAWWQKVPDLTVTLCDLLGPMPKDDHPFFGEVLTQEVVARR